MAQAMIVVTRHAPSAHVVGYTGPRSPEEGIRQLCVPGVLILVCRHIGDGTMPPEAHTTAHLFELDTPVAFELRLHQRPVHRGETSLFALCAGCFFTYASPLQAELDGLLTALDTRRTKGLKGIG